MAKDIDQLQSEHTREAIHNRLKKGVEHSYFKDFVYGAIDGIVTTFAIIAGIAGAELSPKIVIILGLANMFADGFSMGVSNFLSVRADFFVHEKKRKEEEKHIRLVPEGEREEVRQIFEAKGFKGVQLNHIVDHITSDYDLWIDTMLQEEFGISKKKPSPFRAGFITFLSFLVCGFIPLFPYVMQKFFPHIFVNTFPWSIALALATFFLIGSLKYFVSKKNWIFAGFETLILGGAASAIAYYIGMALKHLA